MRAAPAAAPFARCGIALRASCARVSSRSAIPSDGQGRPRSTPERKSPALRGFGLLDRKSSELRGSSLGGEGGIRKIAAALGLARLAADSNSSRAPSDAPSSASLAADKKPTRALDFDLPSNLRGDSGDTGTTGAKPHGCLVPTSPGARKLSPLTRRSGDNANSVKRARALGVPACILQAMPGLRDVLRLQPTLLARVPSAHEVDGRIDAVPRLNVVSHDPMD